MQRENQGMATVRRVRVHFHMTLWNQVPKWKPEALEMYLKNEGDMLAVAEDSSFYVGLCERCDSMLSEKVQRINRLDDNGELRENKLIALARYFDNERRVVRRNNGCTQCAHPS